MPNATDTLRQKAGKEEDRWDNVRGIASLAFTGAAFGGAAAVAFGVAIAPLALAALPLAGAVIGTIAWRKGKSARRKKEDPPRDDYFVPTQVEVESSGNLLLGDHPLEAAVAEFAALGLAAVALENAMVTADERAEGARIAGQDDFQRAQQAQSLQFGRLAVDANSVFSESARRLAQILEQADIEARAELEDVLRGDPEPLTAQALHDALESSWALMDALGHPTFQVVADAIRAAAAASDDYGVAYMSEHQDGPALLPA